MKRQPHFRYYWDMMADCAIVANILTDKARRRFTPNTVTAQQNRANNKWGFSVTMFSSKFWETAVDTFPITRNQYRLFARTNETPDDYGYKPKA